ncbi:hypothetical protein ZWY2020_006626 [Hordeum vulgare]|nr:hypothetical protein ZWY2020_006626 [Hordeum vulgare]
MPGWDPGTAAGPRRRRSLWLFAGLGAWVQVSQTDDDSFIFWAVSPLRPGPNGLGRFRALLESSVAVAPHGHGPERKTPGRNPSPRVITRRLSPPIAPAAGS